MTTTTTRPSKDVKVYAEGLMALSACASSSLTLEEVTAAVNLECPTGISSGWSPDQAPTFKGGEPNPAVCENDPSRRHYLFAC